MARLSSWSNRLASSLPPRRTSGAGRGEHQTIGPANTALVAEDVPLLTMLNDELSRSLDRQWDSITQLDTKAGLLLTFAVASLGVLLAVHHSPLVYGTVAAFVVAIGFSIVCLSVRSWEVVPNPNRLVDLEHSEPELAYDLLIRAKAMAALHNAAGLTRKADWLKLNTWWLAVPVALSVALFL